MLPTSFTGPASSGPQPGETEVEQLRRRLTDALAANATFRDEAAVAKERLKDLRQSSSQQIEELQQEVLELRADRDAWRLRAEASGSECKEAQAELGRCKRDLDAHAKGRKLLTERLRKRMQMTPAQVRLQAVLDKSIVKEFSAAKQGRVLEKIAEKHGTSEVRRVAVFDVERQLRWNHADRSLESRYKSLELRDVTKIAYGLDSQVHKNLPNATPWLCFALVTAERAYAFICPDDFSVQCFMLTLSRLCPVPGAVASRKEFIKQKAKCKIQCACNKRGLTMSRAVLEASRKAARTMGLPGHWKLDRSPTDGMDVHTFLLAAPVEKPANPRGWPQAGETWGFTGCVDEVDVFTDPEGEDWCNQIRCRGKGIEQRAVKIVTAGEQWRMVEVRGVDKLKFVKGWIPVVDSKGGWILDKLS